METENINLPAYEVETLKLIKNTKGYNWEIKIIGNDVLKLEKINNELRARFEVIDG